MWPKRNTFKHARGVKISRKKRGQSGFATRVVVLIVSRSQRSQTTDALQQLEVRQNTSKA